MLRHVFQLRELILMMNIEEDRNAAIEVYVLRFYYSEKGENFVLYEFIFSLSFIYLRWTEFRSNL